MEKWNRDELLLLANKLNVYGVKSLCQLNKNIRNKLCNVWEYKLLKEYQVNSKDPKEKYFKLASLSTIFWTKKREYNKNIYSEILKLWVDNIDKLLEIFKRHYPKSDAPAWVDYNIFRNTKLVEMLEKLSESLQYRDHKFVYLTQILPIAYCSSELYTGSGSMIEDLEFQTQPNIPIEEFIF